MYTQGPYISASHSSGTENCSDTDDTALNRTNKITALCSFPLLAKAGVLNKKFDCKIVKSNRKKNKSGHAKRGKRGCDVARGQVIFSSKVFEQRHEGSSRCRSPRKEKLQPREQQSSVPCRSVFLFHLHIPHLKVTYLRLSEVK